MLARLTAASLIVLSLLSACSKKKDVPKPDATTPVFLISIDTLRSDHLPVYGYSGVETPNLDAFRGDAILYEKAYSHCPLTLPSHTSMLTGLLPSEHGTRDNVGYALPSNIKTLPEALKANGYATGAAISAFVLRREGGLNRGFDLYDDEVEATGTMRSIGMIQRDGAATAKVASDWIAKQQKPVFFFLHIYEPHTPYTPPEPFKSKYASAYDGEIAHADDIVGKFLQSLKDAGLYDKSLIIITSDHGEGLGEHGEDEHGVFLYREAIQVPLLVKLPHNSNAGATVAAPVQHIDLAPTIYERTATQVPAKLPGRSLTAFLGDTKAEARKIYSESYYPRFHFGWSDQHSLVDGQRHYIHSPKPELYDLTKDAAETANVYEQDRRSFFAFKQAIEPFIQEAAAPAPVDSEDAAKFAALGYLGSTVQTKPGEILPDPKDNITAMKDMGRAFSKYRQKAYPEALQIIEKLLETNHRILDLWDLKSKVLARLGRPEDAIAAAQEGLKLSPRAANLAIDIAKIQLDLKRYDEAQQHAELAVKAEPGQAHEVLAQIALGRKDMAKAEEHAKLAMQQDRDRVAPLMTLARVQRDKGDLELALATLNDAISKKKPKEEISLLYFLRGDVYARLGRGQEAEQDFRTEIENFPDDPTAYKNLVLLLVAEGRIPEATGMIRQLVQEAPIPPSYVAVCQVLDTLGDQRGVKYWARQGLVKFPDNSQLRRLAG
ncbi:MAG TPA: sulfatase-like hydrolase/transferase [Thermoanaerobaculia bacterium]|jgi:arylsulfatase A-like enzyme/Tfp pilus assembly protein PilF